MRDINKLPTWLYYLQHGDEDLYVGVTCHLPSRVDEHRAKTWWAEVEHVLAYRFPTREQALAWEALHIRAVRPRYNREVPPEPIIQPGWCWFCGWIDALDGHPDELLHDDPQPALRVLCHRCKSVA